jgi:arylsulfatase A-like enzyme
MHYRKSFACFAMHLGFWLGGLVAFHSCHAAADKPADRPTVPWNVLFIAIDDLRPELGSFAVRHARTPHLDRLVSQSVLFTRHYVQVPTCGASRYALLTGRSPARSGVTSGNNGFYGGPSSLSSRRLPGAQTLPELFRRSGYHTVCLGKISHTADGKVFAYDGQGDGRPELPHAWSELATPYGAWERGWGIFFGYADGLHREDGHGNRDLMQFTVESDDDLPDGMLARTAVQKLTELKARSDPLFLGLGFFKPHLPWVAPRQDWEAMLEVDMPAPPHPEKWSSPYWHGSGEFYNYDMPFPKKRPLPPEDQITARRAYLACVRYTDRQVGRVLKALDDLDLSDRTIVVVWGDHGWHLGDSSIWGKHSPFERAVHSPLIIRAPGVGVAGLQSPALVETTDIYPTLVDLAQPSFQKTAHPLDGISLKPLLQGRKAMLRARAISYWKNAVTVRTDSHRLVTRMTRDGPKGVELFEMRQGADPTENLAHKEPRKVQELLMHVGDGL